MTVLRGRSMEMVGNRTGMRSCVLETDALLEVIYDTGTMSEVGGAEGVRMDVAKELGDGIGEEREHSITKLEVHDGEGGSVVAK